MLQWDCIILGTCPKLIRRPQSSRMKRDCMILEHMSRNNPVTSVIENVAGLYHPLSSIQNGSSEIQSSRRWQDCIILELLFKTDLVTLVMENVVGFYHP